MTKTFSFTEHFSRWAPVGMLLGCMAIFGAFSPQFLRLDNLGNIGVQAAPVGIVAIGMTFVLLTGGVDLSVGAIMFLAAACAGKIALGGGALLYAVFAMLAVGIGFGFVNAFFVSWTRLAAFIVTLSMLFIGRGLALWLTQTRAMNLPSEYLPSQGWRVGGVPVPFLAFMGLALGAHMILMHTVFGRHVYAVGHSREVAHQAGIATGKIIAAVYVISGLCAAAGALLALRQLGAVTPKFGENYEFKAIAAAVLGGTSLFGGRGGILPGTVLGVLLIQTVENGLVLLNADPYLYPLITSTIIFSAVLLDSVRNAALGRAMRRKIRREP